MKGPGNSCRGQMHALASKQRYNSARLLHWRWLATSFQLRDDKLAKATLKESGSGELKGGVVRRDRKKPVPSGNIKGHIARVGVVDAEGLHLTKPRQS